MNYRIFKRILTYHFQHIGLFNIYTASKRRTSLGLGLGIANSKNESWIIHLKR